MVAITAVIGLRVRSLGMKTWRETMRLLLLLLLLLGLEFVRVPPRAITPHSSSGVPGRCATLTSASDKPLAPSLLRANPRLLVTFALLSPTPVQCLNRTLEHAQPLGADNTLEIRFDKDDKSTFQDVREILTAVPQVGVEGAFARRFDAYDGFIRKRGIRTGRGQ
jgi:hypothetical protein